jgi:hypothetical protein
MDIRERKPAMSSSENLRYRRNASLLQRPKIRILESGMPAEDAAEAPPILNECVLIFANGKTRCNIADNLHRVRNEPFSNMNNGPDRVPLRYENILKAKTGQNLQFVWTKRTTEPTLKGSVLDFFNDM